MSIVYADILCWDQPFNVQLADKWGLFVPGYTLKPRPNGRHFPDDILERIFLE